jgi:hypothetical protein
LHLLIAAIATWNTIYLTEAFATLRRRGEEISETPIAHIAPLEHQSSNGDDRRQASDHDGQDVMSHLFC